MNCGGIVRNIDCLGRVVIPKEVRRKLHMKEGDPVTIIDYENVIFIKKYRQGCIFCGNEEGLIEYKHMCVCKKCRDSLNQ